MISFIDTRKKMDERFIQNLKGDVSLGRGDRIRYGDRDGKGDDIYVISDKEIVYDIVHQDLAQLEERLSRTVSFYINKYEKINRIIKEMGYLVDRFTLIKSLW